MPHPNVTDQERRRRTELRQAYHRYLCRLSKNELQQEAERLLALPVRTLSAEEIAYAFDIAVEDVPDYKRITRAKEIEHLNNLARTWEPKAKAGDKDATTIMHQITELKRRLLGNLN
jgi:hypothetical protein